jgi:hypothetical protein
LSCEADATHGMSEFFLLHDIFQNESSNIETMNLVFFFISHNISFKQRKHITNIYRTTKIYMFNTRKGRELNTSLSSCLPVSPAQWSCSSCEYSTYLYI